MIDYQQNSAELIAGFGCCVLSYHVSVWLPTSPRSLALQMLNVSHLLEILMTTKKDALP